MRKGAVPEVAQPLFFLGGGGYRGYSSYSGYSSYRGDGSYSCYWGSQWDLSFRVAWGRLGEVARRVMVPVFLEVLMMTMARPFHALRVSAV